MASTPGVRQSGGGDANAFGAGLATAVGQVGDDLYKRDMADLAEANEARAKELDMQYNSELRSLLHDPEKGYYTKEGKNALEGMDPTNAAIDELNQRYLGEAGNGDMRDMLENAINRRTANAKDGISVHARKGFKTWKTGVSLAKEQDSIDDGALNWTNVPVRQAAFLTGEAEVIERGMKGGKDSAEIHQDAEAYYTKFHIGVATAMLRRSPELARDYLQEYKREGKYEMDGTVWQSFMAQTDDVADVQKGLDAFNAIVAATRGEPNAMLAAVRKVGDAKLQKDLMDRAKNRIAMDKTLETLNDSNLREAADTIIKETGSVDNWSAAQRGAFTAKEIDAYKDFEAQRAAGKEPVTNPDVLQDLRLNFVYDTEEFLKLNLGTLRNRLSSTDLERVTGWQMAEKSARAKGSESTKLQGLRTQQTIVNDALLNRGIDISDAKETGTKGDRIRFYTRAVDERIQEEEAERRAKGDTSPIGRVDTQRIVDEVGIKMQENGWFEKSQASDDSSDVYLFDLYKDVQAADNMGDMTQAQFKGITDWLRQPHINRPLTLEEVRRVYKAWRAHNPETPK
tara:strand:+ start:427 stop:2133 length:1707 start_codon:yes stop_codon:yes gene_type:complete